MSIFEGALTNEQVQDIVARFLQEGSNVILTYNDADGTLTIASTGTGTSSGISAERARDIIAAFVTGGDNITVTHDDGGNTLTISTPDTQRIWTEGRDPAAGDGKNEDIWIRIYPDERAEIWEKIAGNWIRLTSATKMTDEILQDKVATFIRPGTNINVHYDDEDGTFTITATSTLNVDVVLDVHTTQPDKAYQIGADIHGNFYVSEEDLDTSDEGDWTKAVIPNFDDAYSTRPPVGNVGEFYYDSSEHSFFEVISGSPNYWSRVTPSDVFLEQGDIWLGEFNTSVDALAAIDTFVNAFAYYAFFDGQINVLTNSTYVSRDTRTGWMWRRVAGEEAARIAQLFNKDGESALQLAIAALARLDALDVQIGSDVTPVATYNIDDTTALAGAGGAQLFTHNITSLQADDVVVMEWEDFSFQGATYEHAVHGSSDLHGRAYFQAGDLGVVPVQGVIGRSTDVLRKASDNSNDTLGSHLALSAVWNSQFSRIEVHGDKTVSGTANDIALLPPEDFTFSFKVYRNASLNDALEGSIHTQITELQENWDTVNGLKVLTQAQYTALNPKDSTTLYVVVG